MTEQDVANELDTFLKGRLQGQPTHPPADLPPGEADLATTLINLIDNTRPEPQFVADLERQLRQKARSAPAGPQPSFFDTILRSLIPMKRTLLTLGSAAAFVILILLGWQLLANLRPTDDETLVAAITPQSTNQTLPLLPRPEGAAADSLQAVGGGDTALVEAPLEEEKASAAGSFDLYPYYSDIFSGTNFVLNTTLPSEPNTAAVYQQLPAAFDLAYAQQLATQFGFTGPLYTQTPYPIDYVVTDGQSSPSSEGGVQTVPAEQPPLTYFAFDGSRQLVIYLGGASYYDSSVQFDYTTFMPYSQAGPLAEAFLQERGLLTFPYTRQQGYGSTILFTRLIDGRPLNFPEISVDVSNTGQIFGVYYQLLGALQTPGNYPLQSAEAAWQQILNGITVNQIPFNTLPNAEVVSQPPVVDDTYQYWPRTYQAGDEGHFYFSPTVYVPAGGQGDPYIQVGNYVLQGDPTELQAIADNFSNILHIWGQIGRDNKTLTLAGWEIQNELPYFYLNGTIEHTAEQTLLHATAGQTYILPNAPADLPNGLLVDVSAPNSRDAGLAYPVLDWDGINKTVNYDDQNVVDPGFGVEPGIIDGPGFAPFAYQQITISTIELAYYYLPVYANDPADPYALPTVYLQPVWKFIGQTDQNETIEFYVPAVAPEYFQ